MLKIGDFSKVAQVSVKTLRYYGERGLLEPAWMDRFSGYRYYTLDQLPRLNRIFALKDLGFSLDQIQQLLTDDLSVDELRGMVRMKHAELERHLAAEEARLARLKVRLFQIEREGPNPAYEVVLKSIPPQQVAGIRTTLPTYSHIGPIFAELYAFVTSRGRVPAQTPAMALHYDSEYRAHNVDVEVALCVSKAPSSTPRVAVHTLPGIDDMACAIHQGPHARIADAYGSLMRWIDGSGYRVAGVNRELYWQGPASGVAPDEYVTEVQFPVERKPTPFFMTHRKEAAEMDIKIVELPAFKVVGPAYRGKNENNEIAQMWQQFMPRFGEIGHKVEPQIAYGVCDELDADGAFTYVAGFAVAGEAAPPNGMVAWDVPAQQYAIFPTTLKTIPETYAYVFQEWLPSSGYQRAAGPDFEYYDEDFDANAAAPKLYIYIPVVQEDVKVAA